MCLCIQTVEVTMSHNAAASHLGFHLSQDAVITDVEPHSVAATAGLKPLSRLVRISGSDVVAMTHDQMTDVLRSSASVVLTVIPPQRDSHARRSVLSLSLSLSLQSSAVEQVLDILMDILSWKIAEVVSPCLPRSL